MWQNRIFIRHLSILKRGHRSIDSIFPYDCTSLERLDSTRNTPTLTSLLREVVYPGLYALPVYLGGYILKTMP